MSRPDPLRYLYPTDSRHLTGVRRAEGSGGRGAGTLAAGSVDALFATGPFGEEEGVAVSVGAVGVTAIMPRHHPRVDDPAAETQWVADHTVGPPPAHLPAPPTTRVRELDIPGSSHPPCRALVRSCARAQGLDVPWPG
jgi:hypothetical protein